MDKIVEKGEKCTAYDITSALEGWATIVMSMQDFNALTVET